MLDPEAGAGAGATRIALLFDFGGTLDADGVAWKERMVDLWAAEGIRPDPAVFDRAFYAADDALVGAIAPDSTLAETVAGLSRGVAGRLGVSDRALADRIAARFVADALAKLRANRAVLMALGERYRLGIVSNFYGNLAAVCAGCAIDDLFAVVVDSARVGYTKPDPRIFRAALTALGTNPEDAVFIGDSARRDMAGARALGMSHVWLRRSPPPADRPCCPGDSIVSSLGELPPLLLT
jgi:FMN phosphatase YigB (HAD superfamily)